MFKKQNAMENLFKIFSLIPGIGKKSALKVLYYILSLEKEKVLEITDAIINANRSIKKCKFCRNYTENDICKICSNEKRDKTIICIVENPNDIRSFEKINSFFGRYYVLHGLISPTKGIGPKELDLKDLFLKIKNNDIIKEVILATNPTVEGETTARYIAKFLKPLKISISRLAYGISVGSEIQYTDKMTILKAIENRNRL